MLTDSEISKEKIDLFLQLQDYIDKDIAIFNDYLANVKNNPKLRTHRQKWQAFLKLVKKDSALASYHNMLNNQDWKRYASAFFGKKVDESITHPIQNFVHRLRDNLSDQHVASLADIINQQTLLEYFGVTTSADLNQVIKYIETDSEIDSKTNSETDHSTDSETDSTSDKEQTSEGTEYNASDAIKKLHILCVIDSNCTAAMKHLQVLALLAENNFGKFINLLKNDNSTINGFQALKQRFLNAPAYAQYRQSHKNERDTVKSFETLTFERNFSNLFRQLHNRTQTRHASKLEISPNSPQETLNKYLSEVDLDSVLAIGKEQLQKKRIQQLAVLSKNNADFMSRVKKELPEDFANKELLVEIIQYHAKINRFNSKKYSLTTAKQTNEKLIDELNAKKGFFAIIFKPIYKFIIFIAQRRINHANDTIRKLDGYVQVLTGDKNNKISIKSQSKNSNAFINFHLMSASAFTGSLSPIKIKRNKGAPTSECSVSEYSSAKSVATSPHSPQDLATPLDSYRSQQTAGSNSGKSSSNGDASNEINNTPRPK